MSNFGLITFSVILLSASLYDLKFHKIPNWLTFPALLIALIQFEKIFLLIIAIALFFAILFGKYIGAGDIKLGTATAFWCQILDWSQYWIYAALAIGGVFGLIFRQKSLPFAPFIAFGVVTSNLVRVGGFF